MSKLQQFNMLIKSTHLGQNENVIIHLLTVISHQNLCLATK